MTRVDTTLQTKHIIYFWSKQYHTQNDNLRNDSCLELLIINSTITAYYFTIDVLQINLTQLPAFPCDYIKIFCQRFEQNMLTTGTVYTITSGYSKQMFKQIFQNAFETDFSVCLL